LPRRLKLVALILFSNAEPLRLERFFSSWAGQVDLTAGNRSSRIGSFVVVDGDHQWGMLIRDRGKLGRLLSSAPDPEKFLGVCHCIPQRSTCRAEDRVWAANFQREAFFFAAAPIRRRISRACTHESEPLLGKEIQDVFPKYRRLSLPENSATSEFSTAF